MHAGLVQAVTSVVRPSSSYQALELGVAPQALGALSAGFAVLPLLAAVAVGRLTDRRGQRPVLLAGAAIVLAATVAFVAVSALADATTGLVLLVGCSAGLGFGHLLVMVAEQSLVAEFAQERGRDTAFGHYTFAVSAGQVVGPAALAVLGRGAVRPDTGALFLSGVGMAVLLLVVALGLNRTATTPPTPTPPARVRRLLRTPGLSASIVASIAVVSTVDIVAVYLPALGLERGLSSSTVGLLLILRAAASMLSRSVLAMAVAWLGRSRLLLAGSLAAGAGLVVLAAPVAPPVVAVAVAVAGVGLGVGQPLTMSWVTLLVPARERGTAVSLRLTGNRLGQTVVPVVVGLAAGGRGAGAVLAATGALLAGATAVSARQVRRAGLPERGDHLPPPDPGGP